MNIFFFFSVADCATTDCSVTTPAGCHDSTPGGMCEGGAFFSF